MRVVQHSLDSGVDALESVRIFIESVWVDNESSKIFILPTLKAFDVFKKNLDVHQDIVLDSLLVLVELRLVLRYLSGEAPGAPHHNESNDGEKELAMRLVSVRNCTSIATGHQFLPALTNGLHLRIHVRYPLILLWIEKQHWGKFKKNNSVRHDLDEHIKVGTVCPIQFKFIFGW